MNEIEKLKQAVIAGHINAEAPYPPEMKGQDGAEEMTRELLEKSGFRTSEIEIGELRKAGAGLTCSSIVI